MALAAFLHPEPAISPATLMDAMATAAQLTANRLNAQKSTGPRSEAGKAVSRFNALQRGIDAASAVIPGEDAAARESLAHDYYQRFQPATPEEAFLVETMIDAHWNRRRYTAIETQLMNKILTDIEPTEYPLAALFDPKNPASKLLERIVRHREAAERSGHRALNALIKLLHIRQMTQAALPAIPLERTQSDLPLPTSTRQNEPENLALRL